MAGKENKAILLLLLDENPGLIGSLQQMIIKIDALIITYAPVLAVMMALRQNTLLTFRMGAIIYIILT
ncbi:hypothetical protein [Owenweeksia hongkongensis]|uniref:hypothetical protein n=1 Tax=Owenweeksia hongkongensis TaxID=253245 RepID=UPI003A8D5A77